MTIWIENDIDGLADYTHQLHLMTLIEASSEHWLIIFRCLFVFSLMQHSWQFQGTFNAALGELDFVHFKARSGY